MRCWAIRWRVSSTRRAAPLTIWPSQRRGGGEPCPLPPRHEPAPDQDHPDPVGSVDQHSREQEHVEGEERRARCDVHEVVPGVGPADQHRQDQEVQVEVGDQAEAGRPVDDEGKAAEADVDSLELFRLPAGSHDGRVVAGEPRHVAQLRAGAGGSLCRPSRHVPESVCLEEDLDRVPRADPGRRLDLPAARLGVAGCLAAPDLPGSSRTAARRPPSRSGTSPSSSRTCPRSRSSRGPCRPRGGPGTRANRSSAGSPIPWLRSWHGAWYGRSSSSRPNRVSRRPCSWRSRRNSQMSHVACATSFASSSWMSSISLVLGLERVRAGGRGADDPVALAGRTPARTVDVLAGALAGVVVEAVADQRKAAADLLGDDRLEAVALAGPRSRPRPRGARSSSPSSRGSRRRPCPGPGRPGRAALLLAALLQVDWSVRFANFGNGALRWIADRPPP